MLRIAVLPPAGSRPFVAALVLVWLAGCTNVPALDATVPKSLRNAPYPVLGPLDASLTTPPDPQKDAEDLEQELTARRDRLRRRAERLKMPVTDSPAQQRTQSGVTG